MTDKEKIREEVERLYNQSLVDENRQAYRGLESAANVSYGKSKACKQLLSFIDSLQEEPKPKFRKGDKVIYLNEEYVVEDITDHYILRSTRERTSVPVVHVGFGNEDYEMRLVEEPVSEELEEVCEQLAENARKRKAETSSPFFSQTDYRQGVMDGAEWQKNHLWNPADGDDLPEIDREVVVLIKYNAQRNIHDEEYPTYRVGFGHRPNPNGWDGKNIDTNEVTHYTPKLYDNGGWNAPNIVYWLDARLPCEENKIDKEIEP